MLCILRELQCPFTEDELSVVPHITDMIADNLPLLTLSSKSSYLLDDSNTITFSINSISIFRSPSTQLFYSNVIPVN